MFDHQLSRFYQFHTNRFLEIHFRKRRVQFPTYTHNYVCSFDKSFSSLYHPIDCCPNCNKQLALSPENDRFEAVIQSDDLYIQPWISGYLIEPGSGVFESSRRLSLITGHPRGVLEWFWFILWKKTKMQSSNRLISWFWLSVRRLLLSVIWKLLVQKGQ